MPCGPTSKHCILAETSTRAVGELGWAHGLHLEELRREARSKSSATQSFRVRPVPAAFPTREQKAAVKLAEGGLSGAFSGFLLARPLPPVREPLRKVLSDMLPVKDRRMVDVPCDEETMKEVGSVCVRARGPREGYHPGACPVFLDTGTALAFRSSARRRTSRGILDVLRSLAFSEAFVSSSFVLGAVACCHGSPRSMSASEPGP